MEKKARFGTGEGHTVLDKDNLAIPERYVLPHSGKGVQLPFWMGQNYLFQNDILWAFENDFRSSRPFFGASRMALYAHSGKGVQLPFQTTPDSARVISQKMRKMEKIGQFFKLTFFSLKSYFFHNFCLYYAETWCK